MLRNLDRPDDVLHRAGPVALKLREENVAWYLERLKLDDLCREVSEYDVLIAVLSDLRKSLPRSNGVFQRRVEVLLITAWLHTVSTHPWCLSMI